jgi:hypothetical protein
MRFKGKNIIILISDQDLAKLWLHSLSYIFVKSFDHREIRYFYLFFSLF